MTTQNGVNLGLSGSTGTGNFVGATSPSITTPKLITQVNDTNGNKLIGITATGSAVNAVNVANAATLNNPVIAAVGSDTNVTLLLEGQGTGGAGVQGNTSGSSIGAGFLGETITSTVTDASATSFTSGTTVNLTSVNLTAGKWLVTGNVALSGTTTTSMQGGINTTTGTLPSFEQRAFLNTLSGSSASLTVPSQIVNISGTTTYYIVISGAGTGTMTMSGNIIAVRIQ